MLEYLKLIKGDRPKTKDIFEGIDMTWGRVKGASDVSNVLAQMSSSYQPTNPAEARILLQKSLDIIRPFTSDHAWAMIQYDRLRSLALDMEGWVTDAIATQPYFSLRDSIQINLTAFPRLNHTHESVSVILQEPNQVGFQMTLGNDHRAIAASALSFWNEPYWLAKKHGDLYDVAHYEIGLPVENTQRVGFVIGLGSESNLRTTALTYKWVDRVAGERIRPVYVTPVASVIPKSDVLIANGGTQTITVEVEALTDSLTGQLNVTLPDGWGTTKDLKLVNIAKRNERQSFTFQLIPSENAKGGPVKFAFSGPKGKADRTLHEIDYPHIMPQVYYTPAEVKLVPLGVKTTAKTVGYIKGAGDDVPQAIEQLGATVDMIEPSTATLESISKYDAIVVGIRAYNNNHALKQFNPTLMKYVENGGTVVVQYNTKSSDMVLPDTLIGPYPFKLTRDRVTVEEAPPTFLAKDHPLLNTPNTITSADFDGWVQERGLYFVGGFEKHYTPLIAWNDPGEQPLNGGLITCDHGKGRYVYTGISFFRQLPAGVPGAYRLFANLISKRITP
jgi:hypothetical protein